MRVAKSLDDVTKQLYVLGMRCTLHCGPPSACSMAWEQARPGRVSSLLATNGARMP